MDSLTTLVNESGFAHLDWRNLVMFVVGGVLIFLAVKKNYEPLLLIPIGFGAILANLPLANLTASNAPEAAALAGAIQPHLGDTAHKLPHLLQMVYDAGIRTEFLPPVIFLGVGALTDFRPLLSRPVTFLLGAAAQLGIFTAFMLATAWGFAPKEAASIGIIGGADGPTSIFLTAILAPHLLGAVAVAAYSYMSLVPIIQPPIMRLLTTQKERLMDVPEVKPPSKTAVIIFPIIVAVLASLAIPSCAPLIGLLMFGNLVRESGVTDRLQKTAGGALINIVTIFLGLVIGATMSGANFLQTSTLQILLLGAVAFVFSTGGGVVLAKVINLFLPANRKFNPCIGAAGVSAVPMASRVVQDFVAKASGGRVNPLMAAMGPNVAGVIGSAVAAGVFLALLRGH